MKLLWLEYGSPASSLALAQPALADRLRLAGHEVLGCDNPERALALNVLHDFEVLVVDGGLPVPAGHVFAGRLRRQGSEVPVLTLLPEDEPDPCWKGEHWLRKPVELGDLQARLQAFTRRRAAVEELRFGTLRYEPHAEVFYLLQVPLELSPRERDLLRCLMQSGGRVVRRAWLLAEVFRREAVQPGAIEVLVHRLRRKMVGAMVEIRTVRGVGYVLLEGEPSPPPASAARAS